MVLDSALRRDRHENRVSNCNEELTDIRHSLRDHHENVSEMGDGLRNNGFGGGGLSAGAPLPSTPEEVLKLPSEFTGADEDEDGYINPQEAEAIPGLSVAFALLDHDQNCGIDLEEYGYVPARNRDDGV